MTISLPTVPAVSTPPSQADPTNFASRGDTYFSELKAFADALFAAIPELNKIVSGVGAVLEPAAYNSGTTYNFPDLVACVDGYTYRCIDTSVTGVNPVTDDGTTWVRQTERLVTDVALAVDVAGLSSVNLSCSANDSFLVSGFDRAVELSLTNFVAGRTVNVVLIDPGANAVTFSASEDLYWAGGNEVSPSASGATVVTFTKVSDTIVVVSYQEGYTTVT